MEKLEEVTLDDDYPKKVISVGTHVADTTWQN